MPAPVTTPFGMRALLLASLAVGKSRLDGITRDAGSDRAVAALAVMGVTIRREGTTCFIRGVGTGGLLQPTAAIEVNASQGLAEALLALAATHRIQLVLTGSPAIRLDPALLDLLRTSGAEILTGPGFALPLLVRGMCPPAPLLTERLPTSPNPFALVLAALNTPGTTRIRLVAEELAETVTLLEAFGASFTIEEAILAIEGEAELRAAALTTQVV